MDYASSRPRETADIVESLQEFYSKIQEYYDELFPMDEATLSFFTGLLGEFHKSFENGEKPFCRYLGIGCATGTLENKLALTGFDVTGIDMNQGMISTAQRRMKRGFSSIRFFEMSTIDMRRFLKASSFNIVACLGNMLPYIADETLVRKFFHDARALLAPGGKLVLQLFNFDDTDCTKTIRLADKSSIRVKLTRSYIPAEEKKLLLQAELELGNGNRIILPKRTPLLPITTVQAEEWANEAGFTKCERFGSFARDPWTKESQYSVLLLK